MDITSLVSVDVLRARKQWLISGIYHNYNQDMKYSNLAVHSNWISTSSIPYLYRHITCLSVNLYLNMEVI